MKIAGRHTVKASREVVWEAVCDPDVLSRTLPGAEDLQEVAENEFEGALKIKVGPVQGKFQGGVTLSDLQPPDSYRLKISGKGAPGFVNGEGELRLEDDEDGTAIVYQIDAKVGGRIAGVGQRLLDSSAKVITRQALEGLEAQILARQEAADGSGSSADPAAAEAATSSQAPSQAEFAADFTKGLLAELIPSPALRWLLLAVGLLLLAFTVWTIFIR